MCYVMLYSKTFYEEKRVFTFVWNSRYGTFFVFLSNVYETTMISSPRQHFTGTWPLKPAHQELSPPRTPLLPALQRRRKAEAGPGPSTTRGARKHAESTSFFRNTVLASRND